MYDKSCHLPIELKHRAIWVIKQCNVDLEEVRDHKRLQLNAKKILKKSYNNVHIYKEKTKEANYKMISRKNFKVG